MPSQGPAPAQSPVRRGHSGAPGPAACPCGPCRQPQPPRRAHGMQGAEAEALVALEACEGGAPLSDSLTLAAALGTRAGSRSKSKSRTSGRRGACPPGFPACRRLPGAHVGAPPRSKGKGARWARREAGRGDAGRGASRISDLLLFLLLFLLLIILRLLFLLLRPPRPSALLPGLLVLLRCPPPAALLRPRAQGRLQWQGPGSARMHGRVQGGGGQGAGAAGAGPTLYWVSRRWSACCCSACAGHRSRPGTESTFCRIVNATALRDAKVGPLCLLRPICWPAVLRHLPPAGLRPCAHMGAPQGLPRAWPDPSWLAAMRGTG